MFNSGLIDLATSKPIFLDLGVYKISRQKLAGPATHFGVLIMTHETGFRPVVYHQQDDGHHVVSVEEFAQGRQIFVSLVEKVTGVEASHAVERARRILNFRPLYDFFTNNCEHSASEVISGLRESGQIKFLALVCVVAVAVLLVTKASG